MPYRSPASVSDYFSTQTGSVHMNHTAVGHFNWQVTLQQKRSFFEIRECLIYSLWLPSVHVRNVLVNRNLYCNIKVLLGQKPQNCNQSFKCVSVLLLDHTLMSFFSRCSTYQFSFHIKQQTDNISSSTVEESV